MPHSVSQGKLCDSDLLTSRPEGFSTGRCSPGQAAREMFSVLGVKSQPGPTALRTRH